MLAALESAGIWCTRHGAFHHAASVLGPGAAASVLITIYKATFGPVMTAAAGGEGMAGVMARVDVGLDTVFGHGWSDQGETLAWLENIVEQVRTIRQVGGAAPLPETTADLAPAWPQPAAQ
jgi:hypothetical protein